MSAYYITWLTASAIDHPIAALIVAFVSALVCWSVVGYARSPLRKYPGPPLAAWTNYWMVYHASRGSMHEINKWLHEKYGPAVRVGPNMLSLDCPSLIKTCFDVRGIWRKTEFYTVSGVRSNGRITYNIFSETDNEEFTRTKRPIAKYFSVNGVLQFQVAWDMVGKATYGKRIGYLDHGHDFDDTIYKAATASDYLSTIGMHPSLDMFLDKNRIYRIGPPSFHSLVALSMQHLMDRYSGKDKHDPAKPDFLAGYIESKAEYPDVVDDERIISYLLVNLSAGANTTAVLLRSIIYLSLKHPTVWSRLEAEILAAPFAQKSPPTNLPAPYSEARILPYLEAVVRESNRLWPGDCFPMQRYVPASGLNLPDGSFVPEGVIVGFNAFVLHRNKDFWGHDAEDFRPERWLRDEKGGESEAEYKQRLTRMNNHDLSFGGGNRKCLGQHLGLMQVYKTVATLIGLYEFELVHPEKDWTIKTSIFRRQSGIELKLRKRPGMEIREDVGLDE
ncbi:cytochrome P450 [Xylariaceae sp. FL0016]|nr:cytochrome P450 [Xylariaceae sp. FL0016]